MVTVAVVEEAVTVAEEVVDRIQVEEEVVGDHIRAEEVVAEDHIRAEEEAVVVVMWEEAEDTRVDNQAFTPRRSAIPARPFTREEEVLDLPRSIPESA